jgi:hypothetical protein
MDEHHTLHHLATSNPLKRIPRRQTHLNRIPAPLHWTTQLLNPPKQRLKPIKLRLILFPSLSDRERVDEPRVIRPQPQLPKTRSPGKQIEHRAREEGLLRRQGHAGDGGNIGGFDAILRELG